MGSDGAIKLKRKELVKTQTTPTVTKIETKEYTQEGKWNHCHLSQNKLSDPLVSDYLGRLYNKESVLELLLDATKFSEAQRLGVAHITSLKDVVELKIKSNGTEEGFTCSVTGEKLGSGKSKVVYLVQCGDVFIEKCLSFSDELKCPVCATDYADNDIITLNSTDVNVIEKLKKRMEGLKEQGLTHSLKKAKSKRKMEKVENGKELTKKKKKI